MGLGRQTRRGKAEFKVFVRGTVTGPFGGSGAADTAWSLGFQETKPGVWKVNRISPVSLPYNAAVLAGALGSHARSRHGPRAQGPGRRGPAVARLRVRSSR